MISETIHEKLVLARKILSESSPVIVAFSGGVDSTLVLKMALDTLGNSRVLAVTGISPSVPPSEQEEAKRLARHLGAEFLALETHEMENENYRANPANRCYFCKEELFSRLSKLADEQGYKAVVDGSNGDDAKDWRPGLKAAREQRVRSPLLEAGLTKEEIRKISRSLDLPTWDKPAMPCLSSRVPFGEEITAERLTRIDLAEKFLRSLGLKDVRVRDHFPIARIEVLNQDIEFLAEENTRLHVTQKLKEIGYLFVTLDLSGFKSGSLNTYHSGNVTHA